MKILMVTMAMDIGGAETHILELSRELKRRGHDITVASNGGAYESELAEAGIAHVKVPCHSKRPDHMAKSYRMLKELIFRERFDVVHAHARIPAFICEKLHRKYRFRFVTTAHWVFNPGFPYNILTKWGERSLAVSDDIKSYLIKNYGIASENIRVTINGIDGNKFSSATDWSGVAEEFSFGSDRTRIVYVSRMDIDRSYAAHKLIEITPAIAEKIDNLEVVIVGGGNDYDKIAAEAEEVNRTLGRRVIITTGSRTDINRFAASGDLFIGVSRAALEAMACEVPCIIAGNEGYIGIFDEDKLQLSIDTNFCCRGCPETTAENLLRDVLAVLTASPEEKLRLSRYSRETVMTRYSMKTMADDATRLYISVVKQKGTDEAEVSEMEDIDKYLRFNPLCTKKTTSDVMISGYYGFCNMGDDSILMTITRKLRESAPGIRLCALTKNPASDSKRFGIECVKRTSVIRLMWKMRRSRVLISGGGSLFQDSTSSRSLRYYAFIVNLARKMGMKTYIYANGVGVIYSERNKRITAKTVSLADRVTVRDETSLEELISIGVPGEKIEYTADPAFMIDPASDSTETEEIFKKYAIDCTRRYFVLSLRRFEGVQRSAYSEEELLSQVLPACAAVAKKHGIRPLIVSMQPDLDLELSETAQRLLGENYGVESTVISSNSSRELVTILRGGEGMRGAEFVCSMRLHTMIYACSASVPVVGLSLDPKIDSLVKSMRHGELFSIPELDRERLGTVLDEIVETRDGVREELAKESDTLREKAERDIDHVFELLRE